MVSILPVAALWQCREGAMFARTGTVKKESGLDQACDVAVCSAVSQHNLHDIHSTVFSH